MLSPLRRALLWYWANIDTIPGKWYESLNSVFTLCGEQARGAGRWQSQRSCSILKIFSVQFISFHFCLFLVFQTHLITIRHAQSTCLKRMLVIESLASIVKLLTIFKNKILWKRPVCCQTEDYDKDLWTLVIVFLIKVLIKLLLNSNRNKSVLYVLVPKVLKAIKYL